MEVGMADCGTQPGYQQHVKRGETTCEPCKAANREYMQDYNKRNPAKNGEYKAKRAVRDRALERLAREHPERFMELYFEEERGMPAAVHQELGVAYGRATHLPNAAGVHAVTARSQ